MGFMDDYRKALEEEQAKQKKKKKKQDASANESSFMQEYRANLAQYQADDEDDIAPVAPTVTTTRSNKKDNGRKWFEAGAFEDGYQFGDVSRTILGTASDIGENVLAGALGMGEKAVDAGAYLVGGAGGLLGNKNLRDNMGEFIKKDLYNEEEVAKRIILGTDEHSVFGEKSDSLLQSAGQLAGTLGLQMVGVPWFVTSGVTGFGNEAEHALNQGATYGQAGASAAISAGAEILTEKLFGGSGLGETGLIAVDRLTKGIANKTVKTLLDYGVDIVAEGAEEVVSEVFSNLGSALYREEKLGDILFSEEAVDGYIEAAIGGGVLGGVMNASNAVNSARTGRDYRSGLSTNEEKVVEKVYQDAVAEAEKGGKKLSKKEKAKLYDDVLIQMERGYISTDTIEEVLGGESYTAYQDTVKNADAMQQEYDTLYKMKNADKSDAQIDRQSELKKQLDELKATDKRNVLRSKLDATVRGLVQDSYLAESYNERSRRGQAFEADLTQYDAKQQPAIQKAIDSGILNNTNRTHEFVDMIAKISADKGVSFDFLNNEKLKGTRFARDGAFVNGYWDSANKTIGVNIDSAKALNATVGHEITHVLEGTEFYDSLQKVLFDYARSKRDYSVRRSNLAKLYDEKDIPFELTADLVGDYLFNDADFINRLSVENRNVFQKIWDEIKYLCKVATAGSKEARELEKVKRAFEKAYREGGNKNTDTDSNVRLSVTGKNAKNANHSLLAEAIEREASGEDAEKIRKDIGWYRGYDGKWRFEVSDRDMEFNISGFFTNPDVIRYKELEAKFINSPDSFTEAEQSELFSLNKALKGVKKTPKNLGDYLKHDKLFAAYPQLKDIPVRFAHLYDGELGAYNPETNEITLAFKLRDNTAEVKNTLIHEIQHAIQHIEGFAGGSSVKFWQNKTRDVDETIKKAKERLKPLLEEIGYNEYAKDSLLQLRDNKKSYEEHLSDCEAFKANSKHAKKIAEWEAEIVELQRLRNEMTRGMTPVELYKNTAGEIEARDVEGRREMSDEELLNNRPNIDEPNVVFADDTKYSISDSSGKQLTPEQSEFFKDSKVRDSDGNLLKVYHTTQNEFTVFDKGRKGETTEYPNTYLGFFFADDPEYMKNFPEFENGKTEAYYLNVKNPIDMTNITKEAFLDIVEVMGGDVQEAAEVFDEEFALGQQWAQDMGAENTAMQLSDLLNVMTGEYDFDDFYNELKPHYDDLIAKGYDGIVSYMDESVGAKEYIVLDSNQAKLATNQNPTDNPDIRFSLSEDAQAVDDFGESYLGTKSIKFSYSAVPTHKKSLQKNYNSKESSLGLDTIVQRYDKILGIWEKLGGELDSKFLNDWNNKVERPFTIFKAQAGYKYNVELSSMCKKGVPLFEAIDTIVKKEVMKELGTDVLGKEEKEILYDILKQHNFEIPCAICYVEQARQREGVIIDAFLNGKTDTNANGEVTDLKLGWNQVLDSVQREMQANGVDYNFDYVSRDIATDKYVPADKQMDEQTYAAFAEAVKKLANEEIVRYNQTAKNKRPLLKDVTPEAVKKCFKGTLPSNLKIFKVLLTEPSSRFKIQNDLLYSSMTTKNLTMAHNGLYSLFNSQGGVSGYKTKQAPTVYWGEILNKKWKPETTRSEGGIRNQSNSDFQMYTLLDQAQMYMDLSAKGYYLQAYTKVLSELKLFGLSKSKINASLIPQVKVYRNADGSVDVERTMENAGLDENGNLFFDDIEGIDHNEAFMLIGDPEYSKNICGICIGYSDNHIRKLLDDNRVQLIIGFHDKTNDPNKRYRGARYAKNYNGLNEAVNLKDGKTVHIGFNPFVQKAEKMFKRNAETEAFEGNAVHIGKTYTADDIPRLAADLYLEHCAKKGYDPAYKDFADHPNYYKLLADFGLYDSLGHYAPHQKVAYNMPDQVPYLDADGNKQYMDTEAYIKQELQKELVVRDAICEAMADTSEEGIIPQFIAEVNKRKDIAPSMSLSNLGETYEKRGLWDVSGADIAYRPDVAPVAEEAPAAAPATDASVAPDLFPDDFAPMAEEDDADRFASLTDADAPVETDAEYGEMADTIPLTKKAENEIARQVREQLGLSNRQMAEVHRLIQDYSDSVFRDRDGLVNALRDRFGEYSVSVSDETLADIKRELRNSVISVSDKIKGDISDYGQFMRSNVFGKVRTSPSGTPVDVRYAELQEAYGTGYFPDDIVNPTDQFLQIVEVANRPAAEPYSEPIDDATIEETADAIIRGVNEYQQAQREKTAASESSAAFDSLLETGDDYAPVAPDAPSTERVAPAASAKSESIRPKRQKQPRLARATPAEQARAEILVDEPQVEKKKSKLWSMVKNNVLDKGMVFEDLSLATGNRELQARWNSIRYAEGKAQRMMENGDVNAPSLDSIRKAVEQTGKTKQFYEYLYHLHNADRMTLAERFEDTPNKPVFGNSVTADVSRETAANLEKANPEFKQFANDVYRYMNNLRDMLVDGGVISDETAKLWAEMYPHYVPIRRAGDTGLNINVPLDTGRTGVNAPIKRATGGSRDILPLFDTMGQRTLQTYKAIAKNRFGVELKNTLGTTIANEATTLDEAIDGVDAQESLLQEGKNGQKPTFTVFENGEKVTFEITDEMYDAMKPKSEAMAYTNKVLNTVNNVRRGLLTEYNPAFMLTNPIKDTQDVLINSQHAAKTYANYPQAIAELLGKKGHWYQEYMANGGEQNTYFDNETNTFAKEKGRFAKVIGFPLEKISDANNFIERIPRLAEYIASRKAGRSIDVSMLDAARVTTNFAAGGDLTKFLNRNGATFLNASVQGFMQNVRNVREAKANGVKGVVTLAAKFAVAGFSAMALNHLLWDDDEDYEELSDYVKQNYYIVGKYDDGKFVRIPKGRTLAVIQNAFEQMENLVTGNDEVDLMTFADLALSNLAPNNPLDNNILSPIVDVATNETWYGEDMIPSRLADLPAAEQYDESTDSISKWLGEKLNYSPVKINYLLDQYSGGIGDTFLPMITPEAERGDNTLLAPIVDKFTTDSVMKNQNVSDFYTTKDELSVAANGRYATDEDVLKAKYMNSVNAELGELYALKREIQNGDLPDEDKYAEVRDIQSQIVELAKEGLDTYNSVSVDGGYATVGDRHYRRNNDGEWQKLTDKQVESQEEVARGLGISASEYWSNKDEYDYAYDYPEKYAVAKAVGGYDSYKAYSSELYDIKADKDENGKSISGSRKEKVIDYINALDADYGTRIILFKSEYNADDTYNSDIVDYLNSRNDISYEEMVTILKELGFTVHADGSISW